MSGSTSSNTAAIQKKLEMGDYFSDNCEDIISYCRGESNSETVLYFIYKKHMVSNIK